MKNPLLKFLLPAAGVVLVLCVLLYFVNPWAPLLLLLTLAIQLPIILAISKTNLTAGYRERAFQRRARFAENGDAAAWLEEEEKEAASVGFRYWSAAARAQSALNRAQALAELHRPNQAAELLAGIDLKKLPGAEHPRFEEVTRRIREG